MGEKDKLGFDENDPVCQKCSGYGNQLFACGYCVNHDHFGCKKYELNSPIFEDTPSDNEGVKPVRTCSAATKGDIQRMEKIFRAYSKLIDLKLKILMDCIKTGSSNIPFKMEIHNMEVELIKMGGFI